MTNHRSGGINPIANPSAAIAQPKIVAAASTRRNDRRVLPNISVIWSKCMLGAQSIITR